MLETDFLSYVNRFYLIIFFLLQVETVTDISENPFLWYDFVPASRNCYLLFLSFFLQVETVTENS